MIALKKIFVEPQTCYKFTEKEIANSLVMYYRREADGEAYPPIVAGGPNSALPHAYRLIGNLKKGILSSLMLLLNTPVIMRI